MNFKKSMSSALFPLVTVTPSNLCTNLYSMLYGFVHKFDRVTVEVYKF